MLGGGEQNFGVLDSAGGDVAVWRDSVGSLEDPDHVVGSVGKMLRRLGGTKLFGVVLREVAVNLFGKCKPRAALSVLLKQKLKEGAEPFRGADEGKLARSRSLA